MLAVFVVIPSMWAQAAFWNDISQINCATSTYGYTTLANNALSTILLADTSAWNLPDGYIINQTTLEYELWTLDSGKATFDRAYFDSQQIPQNRILLSTPNFFEVDTSGVIPRHVGLRVKNFNAGTTVYIGVSCVRLKVSYERVLSETTGTSGTTDVLSQSSSVTSTVSSSISTSSSSSPSSSSSSSALSSVSSTSVTSSSHSSSSFSSIGGTVSVTSTSTSTSLYPNVENKTREGNDDEEEEELFDTVEELGWFLPGFLMLLFGAIFVVLPSIHICKTPKGQIEIIREGPIVEGKVMTAQAIVSRGRVNVAIVKCSDPYRYIDDVKNKYLCPWLGRVEQYYETYDMYATGARISLGPALGQLDLKSEVKIAMKWISKVCCALRELHSLNLIHGNLHQDCVWIDLSDNSVQICDYRDSARQSAVTIYSDIFDLGTLFRYSFRGHPFFNSHGWDAFVAHCHHRDPRQRPSLELCEQTIRSYHRSL